MQQTMTTNARLSDRRVLLLALALGAITAGLIVAYLAQQSDSGGPAAESATLSVVVVAAREIPVGADIEESMLELKAIPSSALISDAATELEQAVGATARYPIAKGEQLSLLRLVEPPEVKALSFQIPEGMRGFTIPVDVSRSPAGVVVPGDFVDVLVAAELGHFSSRSRIAADATSNDAYGVVTLLQNVQVLSVQRDYVDNGVPYDDSVRGETTDDAVNYVTLALEPEQTQQLWLASQNGEITLALRPFGDSTVSPLSLLAEPLEPAK